MTYTEKVLEEKELSKLVIDLVWSATDGGRKLKESDFSHFEEPLYEWTALVNKFSTSIQQAIAYDRARVRGNLPEIRVSALSLLLNDCSNCGQVINRSFVDDLTCRIQDEYKQKILSSLDESLTKKD